MRHPEASSDVQTVPRFDGFCSSSPPPPPSSPQTHICNRSKKWHEDVGEDDLHEEIVSPVAKDGFGI